MLNLTIAALAFVLLHRVVSGSPVRDQIVTKMGERRFQTVFALASLAGSLWLGIAYATTSERWQQPLWPVPAWILGAQFALQPVALLLIVAGFLSPNPTAVGQENAAARPDAAQGALRITRHPFLWGVALLALGHIAAVPSPRCLALFGSLLVVALAGTRSIDAKRRRKLGLRWEPYAAATSNIPFVAVLRGCQPFRPGEFRRQDLLVAAALAVGTALAHPVIRRTLAPL